jgi:hypothetical protein
VDFLNVFVEINVFLSYEFRPRSSRKSIIGFCPRHRNGGDKITWPRYATKITLILYSKGLAHIRGKSLGLDGARGSWADAWYWEMRENEGSMYDLQQHS